jgi:hypothetical protein
MATPKLGEGNRRRLGDARSQACLHYRRKWPNTIARVPLAGGGTSPPVPVRSRHTGHSGRLWRVAGLARLKGCASAVTYYALTIEPVVPVTSSAPHESAPRRALSPPWPPIQHHSRQLRQTGTNCPHLCTIGPNVTLAPTSPRLRAASGLSGTALSTSSATVWKLSSRSGGASRLLVPWRRPLSMGGLRHASFSRTSAPVAHVRLHRPRRESETRSDHLNARPSASPSVGPRGRQSGPAMGPAVEPKMSSRRRAGFSPRVDLWRRAPRC